MSTKITFEAGPANGFEFHIPDGLMPVTDCVQTRIRLPGGYEQSAFYTLYNAPDGGYVAKPIKFVTISVSYGET